METASSRFSYDSEDVDDSESSSHSMGSLCKNTKVRNQKKTRDPYAKIVKPPVTRAPKPPRADIVTRLRMPEKEYNKIPNKDPYVNKMLMNQIIPY